MKRILKGKQRKRIKDRIGYVWKNDEYEIFVGSVVWLKDRKRNQMLTDLFSGYGDFRDYTDPEDLIDPLTIEWSLYLDGELDVKPFEPSDEKVVWENKKFQILREKDGFAIRYIKDTYIPWIGKVNESEHTYQLLQIWIDLLDARKEDRFVPLNQSMANTEWNLPPYKSNEFMALLKRWNMTLDEFKIRPIYTYAVDQGLIVNEEWRG